MKGASLPFAVGPLTASAPAVLPKSAMVGSVGAPASGFESLPPLSPAALPPPNSQLNDMVRREREMGGERERERERDGWRERERWVERERERDKRRRASARQMAMRFFKSPQEEGNLMLRQLKTRRFI